MNTKQITVYQCEKCNKWYSDTNQAETCCPEYHCNICGIKTPTYHIRCEKCALELRYEKAKLVNDYEGYLYDDERDKYFSDMNDLFEYYYDLNYDIQDQDDYIQLPKYVFACHTNTFTIDIHNAIDNEMENHHEDASYDSLVDLDELVKFIHTWNDKQTLSSISPDYERIIEVKEN